MVASMLDALHGRAVSLDRERGVEKHTFLKGGGSDEVSSLLLRVYCALRFRLCLWMPYGESFSSESDAAYVSYRQQSERVRELLVQSSGRRSLRFILNIVSMICCC